MANSRTLPARKPATNVGRASFGCRICAWLCDRFCSDEGQGSASFWEASEDWEREHSNESELWSEDSDRSRELAIQASDLSKTDREAAFQLFLEAAEAGSVWSMEMVGWNYDTGTVVAADFVQAQQYYCRAICAGSGTATIRYAKLLERHGHHETWEALLEDGVRSDFVPAYFWLAWFRCKRLRNRKTFREARPLLEYAAGKGHPGARYVLAGWMLVGRFGLREIPKGFRLFRESVEQYDKESERGVVEEPEERLAA